MWAVKVAARMTMQNDRKMVLKFILTDTFAFLEIYGWVNVKDENVIFQEAWK